MPYFVLQVGDVFDGLASNAHVHEMRMHVDFSVAPDTFQQQLSGQLAGLGIAQLKPVSTVAEWCTGQFKFLVAGVSIGMHVCCRSGFGSVSLTVGLHIGDHKRIQLVKNRVPCVLGQPFVDCYLIARRRMFVWIGGLELKVEDDVDVVDLVADESNSLRP